MGCVKYRSNRVSRRLYIVHCTVHIPNSDFKTNTRLFSVTSTATHFHPPRLHRPSCRSTNDSRKHSEAGVGGEEGVGREAGADVRLMMSCR